MNISVNEIFGPTIQGEGALTGVPSIFVRLNGCNLRCKFMGSICDTAYTSWHPEKINPEPVEEVAQEIISLFNKYPEVDNLVITGGEPMLQQVALVQLLDAVRAEVKPIVTIETNGTIKPIDELCDQVHLWSVSPKLQNSGQDNANKINYDAVRTIITKGPNFQLKFVYSSQDPECEAHVLEYLNKLQGDSSNIKDALDINSKSIMIMPEGQTVTQINTSAVEAIDVCIRNGWRYCDRTHVRIWGDKRGV